MAFWQPPSLSSHKPAERLQAEHGMDGLTHPQPHVLASPPGTQAPAHLINYTPDTNEVHGPGVLAPSDKLNYSLMPHDAGMGMGAGVDWGMTMGPGIASPGSPPGTTGNGRYAPAQSARDNSFSPGQPPISAHPYGTGPGPQLQATGPETRDFSQRGSMVGNGADFGAGQEAPDPLRRPDFSGTTDEVPDQSNGTQPVQQQPAPNTAAPPAAAPAASKYFPEPGESDIAAANGIAALPGYHVEFRKGADGRYQSAWQVPDDPNDKSKPPVPMGYFLPGNPDPIKGTTDFVPYPPDVRKQMTGAGVGPDTHFPTELRGDDGLMHRFLVDKKDPNNKFDLGVSQKPATPKTVTPGQAGNVKTIFPGTTYTQVFKLSADGTKWDPDPEATATAQAAAKQQANALQQGKVDIQNLKSATSLATAGIYDTQKDASGQMWLINKNTGDTSPLGPADVENGYKVVGNAVVKLPTAPGESPSVAYEPPHDMKVDTINGKTVQYDPRDPKKTLQTLDESQFYLPTQQATLEKLQADAAKARDDLLKAPLDRQKLEEDIKTGKVTRAEAISRIEKTAYDIANPKPIMTSTDIYMPPGMQTDIDYGGSRGVKHYDTGTDERGMAVYNDLMDQIKEIRSGGTDKSAPAPAAAGAPSVSNSGTPVAAAPAAAAATSTDTGKPAEENKTGWTPGASDWQRADQDNGRTPAGNEQATQAGLTGTVDINDPRRLGTVATPEQIAAAAKARNVLGLNEDNPLDIENQAQIDEGAGADSGNSESFGIWDPKSKKRVDLQPSQQPDAEQSNSPNMLGSDFEKLGDPLGLGTAIDIGAGHEGWDPKMGAGIDFHPLDPKSWGSSEPPAQPGDEQAHKDEVQRRYDEAMRGLENPHQQDQPPQDESEIEWMNPGGWPASGEPKQPEDFGHQSGGAPPWTGEGDKPGMQPGDITTPWNRREDPGTDDQDRNNSTPVGDTSGGHTPEVTPPTGNPSWWDEFQKKQQNLGQGQGHAPPVTPLPQGGGHAPPVPLPKLPGMPGLSFFGAGADSPPPDPAGGGGGLPPGVPPDIEMLRGQMGGAPPAGGAPPPTAGGVPSPGAPAPGSPPNAGAMPGPGGTPGPGSPGWTPPVPPGDVAGIGHRFGQEMNQGEPVHSGVDLQAPEGTDTIAPVDGMVESIEDDPEGLGLVVMIRGNDGTLHKLGHLKSTELYRGAQVAKGQNLATQVGSTGNTTGSHLHWAVRDPQGQPVDPTGALGSMASLPPVPGTQMMGPPGGSSSPSGGSPPMPPQPGAPPPQQPPMGGGQDNADSRWDLYEQKDKQSFWGNGNQQSPITASVQSVKRQQQQPVGQQPPPQQQPLGQQPQQQQQPTDQQQMGTGNQNLWDDRAISRDASDMGAGGEWGMGAGAGAVAMTPSQQAQIDALNRQIDEKIRNDKAIEEQNKTNEDNRHNETLKKIDQDWAIHQDQDKRQQEINAENERHNQESEKIQREQIQSTKDIEQMRDATQIKMTEMSEGNKVYLQEGSQAFTDWQTTQKNKMDILGSALQNPWLQKLQGMTPGPGYQGQAVGGQNLSNLINSILQPYDPTKYGVENTPNYTGFGSAGYNPGGGAQGSVAAGSTGAAQPGGQLPQQGSTTPAGGTGQPITAQQWQSWDPFQKAAYRTDQEALGPGVWAQQSNDLAGNFLQQGLDPNVTRMQSAAGGAVGRAGAEMTADIFGQTPQNFWDQQNRQWSQAQAPQVKQQYSQGTSGIAG
jgi:hypothetical protein